MMQDQLMMSLVGYNARSANDELGFGILPGQLMKNLDFMMPD